MTSKERVRTTLQYQEPDRVPYFEQGVASKVASAILGREVHTGGGRFRRDDAEAAWQGRQAAEEFEERFLAGYFDLVRAVDFDMVRAPWRGPGKPSKKLNENTYLYESRETDLWTAYTYSPETDTFGIADSAVKSEGLPAVERQVRAMQSARQHTKPPDARRFHLLQRLIEEFGKERAICADAGFIAIPLETAYLEAMTVRPDLVHTYLDIQLENTLPAIAVLAEMGVDIIWGGGDFCFNKGPVYSPEYFRTFILPRLQKVTETCHQFGLPYFFRTDGWTWPVAEDLFVESGVDGYGEIDSQAGMDLGKLKQELPELMLWGNLDCGNLLCLGSRAEVIAETLVCIRKAAPGGGYILGSSNTIHAGVPPENFLAMIETVKEFG